MLHKDNRERDAQRTSLCSGRCTWDLRHSRLQRRGIATSAATPLNLIKALFFVSILPFTVKYSQRLGQQRTILVTFVVPTTGRATLENALLSIHVQTDVRWHAVVVHQVQRNSTTHFHALEQPTIDLPDAIASDARFKHIYLERAILRNCAGSVRNFALKSVDTPWVAFLDDDDAISIDYVRSLSTAISTYPHVDLVSFRMYDSRFDRLYPAPEARTANQNDIGISFAFKLTHTMVDMQVDATCEDFIFIHSFCMDASRFCFFSRHVTYYVKGIAPTLVPEYIYEGRVRMEATAAPPSCACVD